MLKALARDPEDRYQNAIDLHDDLQSFLYSVGEFYSRKDLAAWMKKTFAVEIEEDNAKLEEFRQIAAPVAGVGARCRAGPAVGRAPCAAAPARARRPPARGAKAAGRPKRGKAAGATRTGRVHQAMGWDDEELDTQIFDKEPKLEASGRGRRPVLRGRRPHGRQRAAARHPRAGAAARAADHAESRSRSDAGAERRHQDDAAAAARPAAPPPAARRPTLVGRAARRASRGGRVPRSRRRHRRRSAARGAVARRLAAAPGSGLNLPPADRCGHAAVQPRGPTPIAPPPAPPQPPRALPRQPRTRRSGPAASTTPGAEAAAPRRAGLRACWRSRPSAVAAWYYWYNIDDKPGRIELTATPDDAVGADRQRQGGRPFAGVARAAARAVHAVGHRDGYVRNDQNIELTPGQPLALTVTLEPSPDTGFELTSDPPGGLVWLDGAPIKAPTGSRRAPTSAPRASRPGTTCSRSRARPVQALAAGRARSSRARFARFTRR